MKAECSDAMWLRLWLLWLLLWLTLMLRPLFRCPGRVGSNLRLLCCAAGGVRTGFYIYMHLLTVLFDDSHTSFPPS